VTRDDPKADKEMPLLTSVDDETYDELAALIGERIVHVALWEDSLADALAERTGETPTSKPPLTSTSTWKTASTSRCTASPVLTTPDADAWRGLGARPAPGWPRSSQARAQLGDVAVDDDDGLVLVITTPRGPQHLSGDRRLAAGGVPTWDELKRSDEVRPRRMILNTLFCAGCASHDFRL
jgi:hypothetical protein